MWLMKVDQVVHICWIQLELIRANSSLQVLYLMETLVNDIELAVMMGELSAFLDYSQGQWNFER